MTREQIKELETLAAIIAAGIVQTDTGSNVPAEVVAQDAVSVATAIRKEVAEIAKNDF